jgi:hypothetical protein
LADNTETKSYQESPAAVIKTGEQKPETLSYSRAVVPPEDANDFTIAIKATNLKRWRSKLIQISKSHFTWSELFLAISTLCLGGYFSALSIPRTGDLKPIAQFFEFTALPSVGVATLVAYFFSRKLSSVRADQAAKELLKDIPDPKDIKGIEANNEPK